VSGSTKMYAVHGKCGPQFAAASVTIGKCILSSSLSSPCSVYDARKSTVNCFSCGLATVELWRLRENPTVD